MGLASFKTGAFRVRCAFDDALIRAAIEEDSPVSVDADGTIHSHHDEGYAVAFRVMRLDFGKVAHAAVNRPGVPPERVDQRAPAAVVRQIRPLCMIYVVNW